jgi:hypothetical protein
MFGIDWKLEEAPCHPPEPGHEDDRKDEFKRVEDVGHVRVDSVIKYFPCTDEYQPYFPTPTA